VTDKLGHEGTGMHTLTFYRQARRDGGVRTGIDIDDDTVLVRFDPGREDSDPALLWYVDVRCRAARLPRDADAAREWLLRQAKTVKRLLDGLADDVPAGADPDQWPLLKEARVNPGVTITVACSAMRRAEAQHIADVLRETAAHWEEWVDELAPVNR
jgi:hypothetical protein